ncbi:hypothetical protein K7432_008747 [Basidiobolus ranarum]|uniref:DH domain-containing protein n=1 Tax=Basidiobolus ranarum TaxID=34480 RepID=A0ABR2WRB2_9FUNG
MSTLAATVLDNTTKVVNYDERSPNSLTPTQLLTLLQQSEHVEEVFEKVKISNLEASENIEGFRNLSISIDSNFNEPSSPAQPSLDDTRLSPNEISQLTRAGTLKLLKDYLKIDLDTLPPTPSDNEQMSFDSDENYDGTLVKLLVKTAAAVEANRGSLRQYDPRNNSNRDRYSLSKSAQVNIDENTPLYTLLANSDMTYTNEGPKTRLSHQRIRSSTDASGLYRSETRSTVSGRSKNVSFKRASTLHSQKSRGEKSSSNTDKVQSKALFTEELTTEPIIMADDESGEHTGQPLNEKSALLWSLIFQELIETERQYVQVLRSLLHCFIARLEKLDWVSYDQKSDITRNIHELVHFQDTFLQSLEASYQMIKKSDWATSGTNPAHCFLILSKQFRVYIPYCSEHDSAQRALTELEKRADWVSFTEECAADIQRESKTTRLPIQSYLMEPIQRICRYPLLLEKLMESTQKDTLAFREVLSARNLIRRIAREINEKKRQKEGREKAKILRNRLECVPGLSLEFVHSLGSIVIAGALLVVNCQAQSQKVKYHGCVLFESYLLIIKAKKATSYEPKHWLPLHKIDIHDFNDDRNVWTISYLSKPILEFQATCEREKHLWFQTLSKLISKTKRARHQSVQPQVLEQSPSSLSLCFRKEQSELLNRSKSSSQFESTLMREPSSGLNNASRIQSLRTSIDIKLGDLFTQECIASRTLEHAAMMKLDNNQTKRSVSAGAIIKPRNKSNRRKTWGHSLVHSNSVSNSPEEEFDYTKPSNSLSNAKVDATKRPSIKINTSKPTTIDPTMALLSPGVPFTKNETEINLECQDELVEHEFSLSRMTATRSLKFRKIFWRGKINSEPNPKESIWKSNPAHLEASLSDDSLHLYKDNAGGRNRGNFFGRMSEKLKPKQRSVNSAPDLKHFMSISLESSTASTVPYSTAQSPYRSDIKSVGRADSQVLTP